MSTTAPWGCDEDVVQQQPSARTARSTCPWDQGDDAPSVRTRGNHKPAYRSTCPWEGQEEQPVAPVHPRRTKNTCPWKAGPEAPASKPASRGKGTTVPPWGLDSEVARNEQQQQQQQQPLIQEEPEPILTQEEIESIKKRIVTTMLDEGRSEEEIVSALELVDIRQERLRSAASTQPVAAHARPPVSPPHSGNAAAAAQNSYDEACSAARATAAKANGGGMAGIFYG